MLASVLLVLSIGVVTGQSTIESVEVGSSELGDVVLQYDDGSVGAFWGSGWFGVWFDAEEFGSCSGFAVDAVEYWFYHYAGMPWVSSDFYAVLANGPISGPTADSLMRPGVAVHMSAVFVDFDFAEMESHFWGIRHTTEDITPHIAQDCGGEEPYHSRWAVYYDDLWVPCDVLGYGDVFIRAHGEFLMSLMPTTWGSIKALF